MAGAVSDTLLGPEGSDDTRLPSLRRGGVCGLVFLVVGLIEIASCACGGCGVPVVF